MCNLILLYFAILYCSRSFRIVIKCAGVCYGRFVIMRCGFHLATYVRGPLVIDERGVNERGV